MIAANPYHITVCRRSSVVERILGKVALGTPRQRLSTLKTLEKLPLPAIAVLCDIAGTFRKRGAKVGRFLGA